LFRSTCTGLLYETLKNDRTIHKVYANISFDVIDYPKKIKNKELCTVSFTVVKQNVALILQSY